jgi:hypothetical protein
MVGVHRHRDRRSHHLRSHRPRAGDRRQRLTTLLLPNHAVARRDLLIAAAYARESSREFGLTRA